MPADPTTPGFQYDGRSNRRSQLRLLLAVAAISFAASSGAAAVAEGATHDAAGLIAEVDDASFAAELPGQAAVVDSNLAAHAEPVATGEPAAESDDPLLSGWVQLGILAAAVVVFLLVFGRRVVAVIDRRTVSWADAWAKTVVIVVASIVSIVIVPAKVLEIGAVQDMSRAAQDLITVGLWSGALSVALLVLWYAHRERRI